MQSPGSSYQAAEFNLGSLTITRSMLTPITRFPVHVHTTNNNQASITCI